jgi:hypothetical protein
MNRKLPQKSWELKGLNNFLNRHVGIFLSRMMKVINGSDPEQKHNNAPYRVKRHICLQQI